MRTAVGDQAERPVVGAKEREILAEQPHLLYRPASSSTAAATGYQKQRMYGPIGVPGPTSVSRSVRSRRLERTIDCGHILACLRATFGALYNCFAMLYL